jgi:hypothetical protein
MGEFAWHCRAWRVNEVSAGRISQGRKHDVTDPPRADHRAKDLVRQAGLRGIK